MDNFVKLDYCILPNNILNWFGFAIWDKFIGTLTEAKGNFFLRGLIKFKLKCKPTFSACNVDSVLGLDEHWLVGSVVEVARFYWNSPNLVKISPDLWLDLPRSYCNLAKVYVYDQLGQVTSVSSWRWRPMIDQWELRIEWSTGRNRLVQSLVGSEHP